MSYFEDFACGLDLGTTFSCIGVYRNGGVEIIPNTNADKTTPSIVTILSKAEHLTGEEALEHLVQNYDSTIFDVKRFIGKDFYNKKVKKGMKLENYPFKMIPNKKKFHEIEINKNNEKLRFSIEEITSYIIKKMVNSAENYLNKKVSKLVITVPANFNDAQRKCTKQAAEIAGIEVLRIINEPTAAALAYGFQEKVEEFNGKILIFDLGGGTFDVTILEINKDEKSKRLFNILSTKGTIFLGGVDFDDKLVDYVLKQFCKQYELSEEEVKKDKKVLRKLKIACEKIKRDLSYKSEVTLSIDNFYDNKKIMTKISRFQFNDMCGDLMEKLEKPLKRALKDAKLTEEKISQIILVGGSTKMPMIKTFLKNHFEKAKINDSINPDEAVAYGATLMAAKILLKDDNILSGFNLFDITPLSLGIEVKNKSEDKEIQKEGGIMSIIINRGSKIPISNKREYTVTSNSHTIGPITIYEGEKKYVKYNHKLGILEIAGLSGKGKVKLSVNFFIDVNGILTVTAKQTDENGNESSVEADIQNDIVSLTNEQVNQLIERNRNIIHTSISSLDYISLNQSLREYNDGYIASQNDEEKFIILTNINSILKSFIDSFDKNFDNETIIEKYYIYIKELFTSYSKTLSYQDLINNNNENKEIEIDLIKNTLEYIRFFTNKSFGYLDNFLETIKDFPKKIFYKIIVEVIEILNNNGKECIIDIENYSRYNSLLYFEKAKLYFENYIKKLINLNEYGEEIYNNCNIQIKTFQTYITEINSGLILLSQDAIKKIALIPNKETTLSNFIKKSKKENDIERNIEIEKYELMLKNYEKMLKKLNGKKNIEEAICIVNFMRLKIEFLASYDNLDRDIELGKRCEMIANELKIESKTPWYKELININENIKKIYEAQNNQNIFD